MKTPNRDRLICLLLGVVLCLFAGCPLRDDPGMLDSAPGVGDKTKKAMEGITSKSSASAQTIKEHVEEPEVVAQFAERIIALNGPATLADVAECKKLLALSKDKWTAQLEKDAKLGEQNRKLHQKLSAAASRLEILAAEAEQRRKDDQVAPFRRILYAALLLLLYYAVVKKDPIQSALCGAVAVFCGAAPWLYDSEAFDYLIWILCIGVGVYAIVVFYDIIKTRLAAKNAVVVAEKLKDAKPEDAPALLAEIGRNMSPIAKAGIRDVKAEAGLAVKESTRLFSWAKSLFV